MVDTDTEDVECTLHVARSVSVFRIPPRPGSNGWRSGEWLVSDKLFSGRLRIVARGELCEIRLEDPNSGELFAICPVHYGQRAVCVEPVTDSSRYYVLRVEDSATRRHAFLGMGFDNRNDAFDFNEALVRHEQQVARERAARAKTAGPGPGSPSSSGAPATGTSSSSGSTMHNFWAHSSAAANNTAAAEEVEGLYRQTAGLRLQEGQTIRVNVSGLKKSGTSSTGPGAGGFLSGRLAAQAPAVGPSAHPPAVALIPPPPGPAAVSSAPASSSAPLASIPPPQILGGQPSGASRPQVQPHPPTSLAAQDVGAVHGTGFRGENDGNMGDNGSAAQAGSSPISTSGQDQWATFD